MIQVFLFHMFDRRVGSSPTCAFLRMCLLQSHRRSECCAGTDEVVSPASPDWLWAPTQWCNLHSSLGESFRSLALPMGPAIPSPSAALYPWPWQNAEGLIPSGFSRPGQAPHRFILGFNHRLTYVVIDDFESATLQCTIHLSYCWPVSEQWASGDSCLNCHTRFFSRCPETRIMQSNRDSRSSAVFFLCRSSLSSVYSPPAKAHSSGLRQHRSS